jgi:hypothetical protein
MRKAQLLLVCSVLLCAGSVAEAQKPGTPKPHGRSYEAAVEREVREFFDSYAEDLRRHRRESIVARYDPRGVFFLGHGAKTLRSFESIRDSYLTKWVGPKSFEWKDISVEVLSPDAAVVVGRFDWQTGAGQSLTYSYTGLLVRRAGRWRIRVEDESTRPVAPTTQ